MIWPMFLVISTMVGTIFFMINGMWTYLGIFLLVITVLALITGANKKMTFKSNLEHKGYGNFKELDSNNLIALGPDGYYYLVINMTNKVEDYLITRIANLRYITIPLTNFMQVSIIDTNGNVFDYQVNGIKKTYFDVLQKTIAAQHAKTDIKHSFQ